MGYIADRANSIIVKHCDGKLIKLSKGEKGEKEAKIIQVGLAVVSAAETVYDGLVEAALILSMWIETIKIAKQGKETAVGMVGKRYGEDAGFLVKEGVEIGENVLEINKSKKGIVAHVATAAAKGIIQSSLSQDPNY